MKTLKLAGKYGFGSHALVDEDDYELLKQYRWYRNKVGYVWRYVGRSMVYLHREIMRFPKTREVDHVNGNRLDNRKINLRTCTHAENRRNNRLQKNNRSGYIGVNWVKRAGKWRAEIQHNYKSIHVGLFDNRLDAAKARDKKAKELWGEHASLNL
jgi:hypothetical protein